MRVPDSHPAESALVILVPEAERLVRPFREQHDPSAAAGVPAHITLLYPFLPPGQIDGPARVRVRQFFMQQGAFAFSLSAVRRFESPTPVLYLVPEPAAPFAHLTLGLSALHPNRLPYGGKFAGVVPHLTVAQAPDARRLDAISDQFAKAARDQLPIAATAGEAALLDNQSGRWETRAVFSLSRS
jgi:2'-5' RNA ligase superfamily